MLLFDAATGDGRTTVFDTRFELVLDRVMGGRSTGALEVDFRAGRRALCLSGQVSLENNGGFVQMATDLPVDASRFRALLLEVWGNGETYGCHLRTPAVARPWQSYRQTFSAPPGWTTVELPLLRFTPHRLDARFDPARIRRLGLVGIGRAFAAELAVGRIELTAG